MPPPVPRGLPPIVVPYRASLSCLAERPARRAYARGHKQVLEDVVQAVMQVRTKTVAWEPGAATIPDPDWALRATQLAGMLRGRRAVMLTGAGVSTPSGIPDYRGPRSVRRTPMTFQQFVSDPSFRQVYWARNHVGWRFMDTARPNRAHTVIAEWERLGQVVGVITQNVDMLHLKAGSSQVVDLHGNYGSVACVQCRYRVSRWAFDEQLCALNPGFRERVASRGAIEVAPDADAVVGDVAGFYYPDCPECGGILKPNIVYFGENVPRERVAAAHELVDRAEMLVAVGSSLTVQSGFRFVRRAVGAGLPVVVINRGATRADALAALRIDADCVAVLTTAAAALRRG